MRYFYIIFLIPLLIFTGCTGVEDDDWTALDYQKKMLAVKGIQGNSELGNNEKIKEEQNKEEQNKEEQTKTDKKNDNIKAGGNENSSEGVVGGIDKYPEPPIEILALEFSKRFMQETEGECVVNFNSKVELVNHLSEIINPKMAQELVNRYYKEIDGKLYVVPTEWPIWLNLDLPYKTDKIDKTTYRVVQKNENDLWGKYQITLLFKYRGDHWVIDERQVEMNN